MKKVTAIVAIGAAMTIFTAANPAYADGWQRSRKVIGPYGGVHTFEGRGYCNENGCKSRQQWTGPRGRTLTRHGRTKCYDGYCQGSAKWAGPHGGSAVVKRRFRRY